MMAYLKLAVNPDDNESFRRVLNKPARGIGSTSESAIIDAAAARGLSFFKSCDPAILAEAGVKSGTIGKILAFREMIAGANAGILSEDAFSLAHALAVRSGLYAFYKNDNSVEAQSRAANIEELLNAAKTFVEEKQNQYKEELLADENIEDIDNISGIEVPLVTLGEFLEDISLLSAVDMVDDEDASNKIALMTIHSAKGLEFPYVYIAGMEENIFPSGGVYASPSDVEEERRLFYVALTRAKVAVNLSFAATRMRNGKHEENEPSRFVREIDPKYIDNPLPPPVAGSGRTSSFGGFGSRFAFGGDGSRYGREGGQRGGFRETGGSPWPSARTSGIKFGMGSEYAASGSVTKESHPVSPVTGRPLKPVSREGMRKENMIQQRGSADLPRAASDEDFVPVSVLELHEGQRIEHNRFGFGVIESISGKVPDLKAKIRFDSCGEKILLLKYAKIRPVQT